MQITETSHRAKFCSFWLGKAGPWLTLLPFLFLILFLWQQSPDGTVWPFNMFYLLSLFLYPFFFFRFTGSAESLKKCYILPYSKKDCFLASMSWWWDWSFLHIFGVFPLEMALFFSKPVLRWRGLHSSSSNGEFQKERKCLFSKVMLKQQNVEDRLMVTWFGMQRNSWFRERSSEKVGAHSETGCLMGHNLFTFLWTIFWHKN